jgi:hypothetical protein
MKLSLLSALLISALGSLAVGCSVEVATDGDVEGPAPDVSSESTAEAVAACKALPVGCTFYQGIMTCVATTQHEEDSTHVAFSGCNAFNGTTFVPGRRLLTFADVVLVTVTRTTRSYGRHGAVFDTSTATTRQLLSSTLISDGCEPP